MRASNAFLPTLREIPADAEVISHRLLLRAGFIKKTAAGVYSYLPLGWRVLNKMSRIVREEMNGIGAQEVFMPVLIPQELLDETGRTAVDVLMRMKDRNQRDFVLGFTHEEVITDIVRSFVQSWKQLPLSLYQIQTKFRDEPRPRAGLLRGREFLMKDSYSFDVDVDSFMKSYNAHSDAYERIFRRFGLEFLAVDADPGDIGGSESREFMILAESGEDTVLVCNSCGYAANAERAEIGNEIGVPANRKSEIQNPKSRVVSTPGAHTVAQVCEFLGVGAEKLIKTIIADVDGKTVAALVRGDRELNLPKLGRLLDGKAVMADAATIQRVTNAPVGFAGPVGLSGIPIILDLELTDSAEMVVGANETDAHRVDVTPGIDFEVTQWGDLRVAVAGDRCSQCSSGRYRDTSGIEVGHIFQLGTKYSSAMQAQVTKEGGQNVDIVMGCYGLGVSRTMASAIEALHDDDGIMWPITIAPYQVVIVLVNGQDDGQRETAERIYAELVASGVEVMFDDRNERSGVKFKDADLIGYPIRITVGRAVSEGNVELLLRREKSNVRQIPISDAAQVVKDLVASETAHLTRNV